MPTSTEQALIDAYGDPTGIISQSIGDMLMNPYGGMVDVRAGQEPSPTGQLTPWGGPLSVTLPGTHPIYSNVGINDFSDLPLGFGELERQRNLVDILVAGGDLKAPSDYSAPVDVYGAGRLPGHYIDSDTYGYQAGLKAALAKQVNPLGAVGYGMKQMVARQPENITDAQWELIKEAKSSAAEEATDAYDAAQLRSVGDPYLENISPSVQDQIDRDEAAGLFNVGERSMASNVTWKPGTALSGKELNQWLKQGNVLTSSTARADGSIPKPGDVDFRGFTKDDVPSRTQQTLNTVMKAAPFVRSVIGKTPIPAALSALTYSSPVGEGSDIVPDYNVQDQMAQWYERAFIDPDEYGWTRPTIEQRQEAIRGVQDAPKGFWGALQDRIANLIPGAEASISRDVEFEREQREPTWFPPTTSSGIGGMVEEPATSPFIGDEGFTPSLGGYTIGGPEVGDEEEEVSEERVKVIKKKPKEKRTSVEEQVVVASEVKKALDNASKGKKVKNELKAVVELAKVDPTIVKRYTTPGSQALQDITAQVDSFSFMPTIQKKKKTVDPWAFEDRRGGRR